MRLAALFSGGKDSTYATYLMEQQGHSVTTLVSVLPRDPHSMVFHTPNLHLLPIMAEAMGKGMVTVNSDGTEEGDLEALARVLSLVRVDGVVTGAIASDYQWDRINGVCERLGLRVFSPLWRKEQEGLMRDLISSGTRAVVVAVMAEGLGPQWLGRPLDEEALDELLEMILAEGYDFDEWMWYDDMAYRGGLMFSKKLWRQVIMPYQKKIVDWAHSHGKKAHLHCCGNIVPLIPDLIDIGIDMLNPLEVKAGVDPLEIKRDYGDRLVLRGGFDVQKWDKPAEVEKDIRSKLPRLMESGGYIFASDHSVPDNVSLQDYRNMIHLVKEVGTY